MLHRPARTIVSVLGIGIGILLIVFTVGLANGSLRDQAKREGNVGAEIFFRAAGSTGMPGSEAFQLRATLMPQIEVIEGVKSAVLIGQKQVEAPDTNTGKRLLDGIIFDKYTEISGLHIVEGRPFAEKTDEAIVDTAFQKQKKLKIGDSMKFYERNFTIVGTYEPAGGARVKIPLSTMQIEELGKDTSPENLDKGSAILIKIKEGFDEKKVGENILNVFPDNNLILTREMEEIYLSSYPALGVFLNVTKGVAATISALVILLTMYTTVTERTRQIGILKSLGMSNLKIAWTISQEAILLTFCGIITGVILTILLKFILTQTTNLQVEISLPLIAITLVIGLIGGAVGSLYPALRAARLDAVEALSYE